MSKIFRVLGAKGRTTIPAAIRRTIEIADHDVLSFESMDDGSIIIRKQQIVDFLKLPPEKSKKTLLDFLDGLSDEQQAAALVHLSVKMAGKQESAND